VDSTLNKRGRWNDIYSGKKGVVCLGKKRGNGRAKARGEKRKREGSIERGTQESSGCCHIDRKKNPKKGRDYQKKGERKGKMKKKDKRKKKKKEGKHAFGRGKKRGGL